MRIEIVATTACGALVLALAAGAASTFSDPIGDTAGPDVSSVAIANSEDELTVDVKFANRPTLAPGDVVLVDLGVDRDASTGEGGVDLYAVFEGNEEPLVFEWREGAFVETPDPAAGFTGGVAHLAVSLGLVKASSVAVAVTAVGGPDPDISPTDRAPDTGSFPYTIKKPAFRKATVRFQPAQPRAGRTFAVGSVSLLLTVAGKVVPDQLRCGAVLSSRPLRPVRACAWRIPRTAKGKRLTVSITASYGGDKFPLPPRRFRVR